MPGGRQSFQARLRIMANELRYKFNTFGAFPSGRSIAAPREVVNCSESVRRLAVFICLALWCCGAERSVHRFRYANSQPPQHPRSLSMDFFEEELEKRARGRIDVETYYSGVLGRERELMDMVALNILQGTRGGFFADASPKYTLFLLPFLVEDWDQALRLVNSAFAARINRDARKNGFHVPACGISQGFRAHTNGVRPIRRPEDFIGLKMRVPPQEANVITAQAFGANPQELPFTEVYQAAKTGVIDGQDNAPSNLWDMRIHEVQKYLTISNYSTGPDPFMVNLDWYESLPADLQRIFDATAREAIAYSDRMNRQSEQEYIRKLSEYLETNFIEGADLDPFREAARPVYDYLIGKGYFTWEEVEEARRAARGE